MAEAGFAKTYLTMLDSRPAKLSPDHVEDARKFPARPPVRLPFPPPFSAFLSVLTNADIDNYSTSSPACPPR